ncbi:ABC transporter permease [Herbiconiux ginsengi]|uniref:Osmoprotectant transport system permease protein n=1 Tax=Herbiconiux ginsengi TaxID=381665 RepID=A0A1H3T1U5_9MICO|nr:ABC transporter permease [Herbiconiux ginsengi]SDZ43801.1 osmoprotectant transport system permease protein [Herbiconiux ginsengi]
MNLFVEGFAWIFDPANYSGGQGWIVRLLEQLAYTFGATAIALLIAVPLGYLVGHTGRGRDLAVSFSGGFRALPSLGVLILLGLGLGIGFKAPLLTFVIIAIPPILAGAYAGFEAVDRKTIDAARAVGMTEWQVVTRVEIPLGLPLLIGGIRSSLLQVVATATLAAYVSGGALGVFIFDAFATRNYPEALGASILVTALALVLEGIFALLQKLVVPRGVVAKELKDVRQRSSRPLAAAGVPAQEGK